MLIPAGYSDYDYHDPVFVSLSVHEIMSDFWKAFFDEINIRWNGLFDVCTVNGLHKKYFPSDVNVTGKEGSPYVDLRKFNSIEDIVGSLSKRTREDVRRKRQRLNKAGKISFHLYSSTDIDQAMAELPMILAEHSKKWPGSYKAPDFHKYLVEYGLASNLLHMTQLSLDDHPISWHIGFFYGSRYYWYMPVYKSEFQKYSPGQVHLFMCLEDALNKGAVIFDFLRGRETYKNHLAKDSDDLFEFRYESKKIIPSLRNFLSDSIKPRLSRLVGRK